RDETGTMMDNMTYYYKFDAYGNPINQLDYVRETISGSSQPEDIEPMSAGNYTYDEIGQLTGDVSEEIADISWNNARKVRHIDRSSASVKDHLEFKYGPMGSRIVKISKPKVSGGSTTIKNQEDWTYTYYVRDAQGNVMAVYKRHFDHQGLPGGIEANDILTLSEHHIYGSDRMGLQTYDKVVASAYVDITSHNGDGTIVGNWQTPTVTAADEKITITQGDKYYELSNHLGNVLAVITDRKCPGAVKAEMSLGDY